MVNNRILLKIINELGIDRKLIWPRLEIIGDIAILRKPYQVPLNEELKRKYLILANKLLSTLPQIKSVWLASSPVSPIKKTREYIFLEGEHRSETVYREYGCSFKLDIRKVYVSPRLNYEHGWFTKFVDPEDRILNMFSGVGFFSIIPACKKGTTGYAIDINPHAYRYLVENIVINKVDNKVAALHGDAGILTQILSYNEKFDHVVLPYPERSLDYVPIAIEAVKNGGYIHLYIHTDIPKINAKKAVMEKTSDILNRSLKRMKLEKYEIVRIRQVRTVGPRYGQYSLTVRLWKRKSG